MKRSTSLQLTMMAASGFALSACGDGDTPPTLRGDKVEAVTFASLDQCKASTEIPDEECDKAYSAAITDDLEKGPRYQERNTCEDVYGFGNCVPRNYGGSSFFGPMLTGFVIGRMMDGGGSYYRGTGLYRDYNGGYVTGYGSPIGRDYYSGRTTIDRAGIASPDTAKGTPAKVHTRNSVVSRGGFGGGSRSFGG